MKKHFVSGNGELHEDLIKNFFTIKYTKRGTKITCLIIYSKVAVWNVLLLQSRRQYIVRKNGIETWQLHFSCGYFRAFDAYENLPSSLIFVVTCLTRLAFARNVLGKSSLLVESWWSPNLNNVIPWHNTCYSKRAKRNHLLNHFIFFCCTHRTGNWRIVKPVFMKQVAFKHKLCLAVTLHVSQWER